MENDDFRVLLRSKTRPNRMETVSQNGEKKGERHSRRTKPIPFTALKLKRWSFRCRCFRQNGGKRRSRCTKAKPSQGLRNAAAACSVTTESDAPGGGDKSCRVTEEVLKSDEALWELYKRWCVLCEQRRTPEDMERRFKYFKQRAIYVYKMRTEKHLPFGLTCWADDTDVERRRRSNRHDCIVHY